MDAGREGAEGLGEKKGENEGRRKKEEEGEAHLHPNSWYCHLLSVFPPLVVVNEERGGANTSLRP